MRGWRAWPVSSEVSLETLKGVGIWVMVVPAALPLPLVLAGVVALAWLLALPIVLLVV